MICMPELHLVVIIAGCLVIGGILGYLCGYAVADTEEEED